MGRSTLKLNVSIVLFLLAIGGTFFANRNLLTPSQLLQNRKLADDGGADLASREVLESNSAKRSIAEFQNGGFNHHQPNHSNAPFKTDQTAVTRFSGWVADYLSADLKAQAEEKLVASGERLALDRRAALKELIESDPRAALAVAIPDYISGQLPEDVRRHLETAVHGRGNFRVTVADDLEHPICEVDRELTLGGNTYAAFVYGSQLHQASRPNTFIQGIVIDRSIAILDDAAEPTRRGLPAPGGHGPFQTPWAGDAGGGSGYDDTAERSFTQGTKTLLFMPVAFSDDPAAPITQSAANQLMNQVNQWFAEQSYNSTAIISEVTPLLILPETKAYYAAKGVLALQGAARTAALAAGFDTGNYDFDIVNNQFLGAPNFSFAGFATVGGKGLMLQVPSLDVTVHELGHNYGLWHANFWSAAGERIIGPGSTAEYGNSFDTMGARSSNPAIYEFNACFKNQLDWLPFSFVQTVTSSGRYRIYAYDVPNLTGGQKYALRIQKDYARSYWAEFRQLITDNPWTENGLLLNWNPWHNFVGDSLGGTVLLDTTPGTPSGNSSKDDAPVVIGRTFSDVAAGVHSTPITKGTTGAEAWIDVQVNLGDFTSNALPTLQIVADQTSVGTNLVVHFDATAVDPDGDPLAYYWEFGDLTFGSNSPSATKSWSRGGEYLVRCTVSDMRGGLASRHLAITVGSPSTFRVSGRVTATDGRPLEGDRIVNGLGGSDYRGAYTDSDGYYALVNLDAGSYTLHAVKYGYSLLSAGWSNPLSVGTNLSNQDWVASAYAVVQ